MQSFRIFKTALIAVFFLGTISQVEAAKEYIYGSGGKVVIGGVTYYCPNAGSSVCAIIESANMNYDPGTFTLYAGSGTVEDLQTGEVSQFAGMESHNAMELIPGVEYAGEGHHTSFQVVVGP